MSDKISMFEPTLFGDEGVHVARALERGWLSGTSPVIEEFEDQLRALTGTRYCIAVASGTAALHTALLALDVGRGDEVIVPDATILSDALAVILCGATPVFVDVRESDGCLDPDRVAAAVTDRTVGIVAVHLYGAVCDLDALNVIARAKGLWLVEDAAQAAGARYGGRLVGGIGRAGCFSFYANKLVTTGEGGAVATDDPALAAAARQLRNLSFSEEPARRFVHDRLSHNYRMAGLAAALGIGQLAHLDELWTMRGRTAALYRERLGRSPGLRFLDGPAFWMAAVVFDRPIAEIAQRKLAECGIDSRRFFYPLHAQPALVGKHRAGECPVAESLFARGLLLPSGNRLDAAAVDRVVVTVRECARSG